MVTNSYPVKCSILMPCYNRAMFLSEAFQCIKEQKFRNFELIIIDDGSRDDTAQKIEILKSISDHTVKYIYQENAGAYAARQRGITECQGEYIAFYDSDDIWLENHLEECISELDKNSDVDWVFGPCTRVNVDTGKVLVENHLLQEPASQGILKLRKSTRGSLNVIDDSNLVAYLLRSGWGIGLQHSVLRRSLFDNNSFWTDLRNGDDRFFLIRAIKRGAIVGYIDSIQTIYRVHGDNSSAVNSSDDPEKALHVHKNIVKGYERIKEKESLTSNEILMINKRISDEYFWLIGYNIYYYFGDYANALNSFKKGLKIDPFNFYKIKTYFLLWIKLTLRVLKQ